MSESSLMFGIGIFALSALISFVFVLIMRYCLQADLEDVRKDRLKLVQKLKLARIRPMVDAEVMKMYMEKPIGMFFQLDPATAATHKRIIDQESDDAAVPFLTCDILPSVSITSSSSEIESLSDDQTIRSIRRFDTAALSDSGSSDGRFYFNRDSIASHSPTSTYRSRQRIHSSFSLEELIEEEISVRHLSRSASPVDPAGWRYDSSSDTDKSFELRVLPDELADALNAILDPHRCLRMGIAHGANSENVFVEPTTLWKGMDTSGELPPGLLNAINKLLECGDRAKDAEETSEDFLRRSIDLQYFISSARCVLNSAESNVRLIRRYQHLEVIDDLRPILSEVSLKIKNLYQLMYYVSDIVHLGDKIAQGFHANAQVRSTEDGASYYHNFMMPRPVEQDIDTANQRTLEWLMRF
eukprot:GHVH01006875.1.p1 GENE.GHVH01006875.1~~GHVH01006875.1.p1  ORF type:complete len:413 (+),score=60.53 GHVH01006875.1:341-1579(+)